MVWANCKILFGQSLSISILLGGGEILAFGSKVGIIVKIFNKETNKRSSTTI